MAPHHRAWLVVQAPDAPERRFEFSTSPLHIGRDRANQLVLPDHFVSARHAEIVQQDGRWYVRDLHSTNGTTLGGQALSPDTPVPLADGDTLQLGSCTLTFHQNGAAPLAHPSWEAAEVKASSGFEAAPPASARPGFLPRLARSLTLLLLLVAALLVAAVLLAPPRLSLLVLGSDSRPDELRRGERGRTDTLMTIVADRPPDGAVIVSLPRDLWVDIPGHGEQRINTAYRAGGPDAAKQAVSRVLGLPVDRYLLIGLQGVRDVVDAAGGVEIDVETPIHDDAYPTDDYGTVVVDIPAGRQRMDGETALRYARTRHQDSDFGRVARQQRVMVALRNALLQPANWWRLPAVLDAVRRTTQTDLGPLDVVSLGLSLTLSLNEPERLAVGPGLVEPISGADGAYLLQPTPALRRAVAVLLRPHEARLEVLNGSASPGLAKRAADTLAARGFQHVRYGDAPSQPATTVEVRSGARRTASQVAVSLDLPPSVIRESASLPADVDVRVVLGGQS